MTNSRPVALPTPAMYEVNAKEYVVIARGGGGKQMPKSGDKYIAFALPDSLKSRRN